MLLDADMCLEVDYWSNATGPTAVTQQRAPIGQIFSSKAFVCPSCHAYAHQDWMNCRGDTVNIDQILPQSIDGLTERRRTATSPEQIKIIDELMESVNSGVVTSIYTQNIVLRTGHYINSVFFSKGFSCKSIAIWVYGRLIYPQVTLEFKPSVDLPHDVHLDFLEAAKIAKDSPRGAAALLRLCIQKLCIHLGEKPNNLNDAIASLVKKGLPVELQQALDSVRVIGNNAVHPAEMDIRDDDEIVSSLFGLVNYIADRMIGEPRRLDEMYAKLPEGIRGAIQRRDQ